MNFLKLTRTKDDKRIFVNISNIVYFCLTKKGTMIYTTEYPDIEVKEQNLEDLLIITKCYKEK